MANLLQQASTFINDKYKDARLILTDVTEAELLTEEATNNEPGIPTAKTMTRIAEASYDLHDYWRIVDVLHKRLNTIDWKQWRQAYKSLVLLDFLLTHGHQDFAEEFDINIQVIQELGSFKYKDERGIEWGIHMQKRSERVIELLQGGDILNEARLKAVRITNGIQGFGNDNTNDNNNNNNNNNNKHNLVLTNYSSSPSSSIFGNSPTSVIASPSGSTTSSSCSSNIDEIMDEQITQYYYSSPRHRKNTNNNGRILKNGQLVNYDWDNNNNIIKDDDKINNNNNNSLMGGICTKLGISPRGGREFGNKLGKKRVADARLNRQFSMG